MIPLTERQRQVVEAIKGGATYRAAGDQLGISPHTVRAHVIDIAQLNGVTVRPLRWLIANADRLLRVA